MRGSRVLAANAGRRRPYTALSSAGHTSASGTMPGRYRGPGAAVDRRARWANSDRGVARGLAGGTRGMRAGGSCTAGREWRRLTINSSCAACSPAGIAARRCAPAPTARPRQPADPLLRLSLPRPDAGPQSSTNPSASSRTCRYSGRSRGMACGRRNACSIPIPGSRSGGRTVNARDAERVRRDQRAVIDAEIAKHRKTLDSLVDQLVKLESAALIEAVDRRAKELEGTIANLTRQRDNSVGRAGRWTDRR